MHSAQPVRPTKAIRSSWKFRQRRNGVRRHCSNNKWKQSSTTHHCFDDPVEPVGRLSFAGFNYGHKADLSNFREDHPNRCTCAFVKDPCKAISRSCSRFRHDFVGMCEAQTKVVFALMNLCLMYTVYHEDNELTMADHPRFQLLQVVSSNS